MSLKQFIRKTLTVDVNKAKREAFQFVNYVNGMSSSNSSVLIPEDVKKTNIHTIITADGKPTTDFVHPDDYHIGSNAVQSSLSATSLLIIWTLASFLISVYYTLFGSGLSSFHVNTSIDPSSMFSSISTIFGNGIMGAFNTLTVPHLIVLVAIQMTYNRIIERNHENNAWGFFGYMILTQILFTTALSTGGLIPFITLSLAFMLPGIYFYRDFDKKIDQRAGEIRLFSKNVNTMNLHSEIDPLWLKQINEDKSPLLTFGIATGTFQKEGDLFSGIDYGTPIKASVKDLEKPAIAIGAIGAGKTTSLTEILTELNENSKTSQDELYKGYGMWVRCGKGQLPHDLKKKGVISHVISPRFVDSEGVLHEGIEYLNFYYGLWPEQITSLFAKANGVEAVKGDNRIFTVSADTGLYYGITAQYILDEYREDVAKLLKHPVMPQLSKVKFSINYLIDLITAMTQRKEITSSTGETSEINENYIADTLEALLKLHEAELSVEKPGRKFDKVQVEHTISWIKNAVKGDPRFLSNVLGEIMSWINPLRQSARLAKWCDTDKGESQINVADVLKGARYGIALKKDEYGESVSRMIQSLLTAQIVQAGSIRRGKWRKGIDGNRFVLNVVDEIHNILTVGEMEDLKTIREYGITSIYATQDIDWLMSMFDEKKVEAFLNNFDTHLIWNTTRRTKEFYQKYLGTILNVKTNSVSAEPINFRATAENVLKDISFNQDSPYFDRVQKMTGRFQATRFSQNKGQEKPKTDLWNMFAFWRKNRKDSNAGNSILRNEYYLSTYHIDEKQPYKPLFGEHLFNIKKGQCLVITTRSGVRRADICFARKPRKFN